MPEVYEGSPIARYKIFGMPLITFCATAFAVFLVFCLYQWVVRDVYAVNNPASAVYMLSLYVLAVLIYVVARVVRRTQGIDLGAVQREIPED
jgi:uncharacterized membrane protein YqjE